MIPIDLLPEFNGVYLNECVPLDGEFTGTPTEDLDMIGYVDYGNKPGINYTLVFGFVTVAYMFLS